MPRVPVAAALIAAVTAYLLSPPSALRAQGVVRGTVFDSLRSMASVAGAEVVLVGSGRRTTTDRRGRFEFSDVAAGEHTVAFHAPWLDSLGLPALERRISVGSDRRPVEVVLATPKLGDFQRVRCGAELEAGQGILLGDVWAADGRPRPSIPVAARWTETRIGQGQLDRALVATVDTTTASGMFILCGVPRDAEVSMRVGEDDAASGELLVSLDGLPVRRRDVVIGGTEATIIVRGLVRAPNGTPLANVAVSVIGDSARRAVTDVQGRFTIAGMPQRSTQIVLRAIGYQPELAAIDPLRGEVELPDVTLRRAAREIATVTVTGAPMTVRRLEFEQRRMYNPGGRFLTDEDLARLPVVTFNAVRERVARSSVDEGSFKLERNGAPCSPMNYVDGQRVGRVRGRDQKGNLEGGEQAEWFQRAKRIEIYRAAFAPAQFTDFDGCGAVVIWTY